MTSRLQGGLLVGLSAAAFGSMAIFVVWAYQAGANIWGLLLVRFGIAALVMIGILRLRRIPFPPSRQCVRLAALGALYVGQAFCFFVALQYAQASLVGLLLYLYPAFVVMLAAIFLGERLSPPVLVAVGIALLGTALVVGGGSGSPLGIALAVGSAVIYSVYVTTGSVVTAGLNPLAATTVLCMAAAVVAGVGAVTQTVLGDGPDFADSLKGWAALLAIAIFCSVVAMLTFFAGLQKLGPTQTAVISTLEPVVTVVLAAWLLSESLTVIQLCGGLLVVAAVMWQAMARRFESEAERRAREVATPSVAPI